MFFYIIKDPSQHFAYRIYKPYFLAKELKEQGIDCYNDARGREIDQLRYYHIDRCKNYRVIY